VCDAIGILGGAFVANSQLGVEPQVYFDSGIEALRSSITLLGLPKDVYAGLLKAAVFGLVIGVISCSSGLRASGGALGVGHATRQAVRDSIIATIVTNYFMTWLLYR
jgi:phospholipid/cholesterol/gamma-HCH transport system permease protein